MRLQLVNVLRTSACDVATRVAALALAFGFILPNTACDPADTIKVSTTQDGSSGSLRAAITRANSSRSPVTIELAPGTYQLTRCGSEDRNARGDLDLTLSRALTLAATGNGVTIRQTCAGERVLDGHGDALLTLKGITVTGGSVTSADPDEPAQGGGVRAQGDVTLDHATVTANTATGAAGTAAPANGAPVNAGGAYGGGLFVEGSLLANDSVLSLNVAIGGAGAATTEADGRAAAGGAAEGGGAYVGGGIVFNGGSLTENRVSGGNGGHAPRFAGGGGLARGGGLAQRTSIDIPVSITGAQLTKNVADGGNFGGLDNSASALTDPLPAAGDASGGAIACSGALEAEAITAAENSASGGHGGEGCFLGTCSGAVNCPLGRDCPPGTGQGGALATTGSASVTAGTFTQNRAASGQNNYSCYSAGCSGGVGRPAAGGAIWTQKDLELSAAQFSQNKAEQGAGSGGVDGLARGGAAASDAALTIDGGGYTSNSAVGGHGGAVSGQAVSIVNATFTTNTASGRAGAIAAATLTAEAVTASENTAGGSGGGAIAVSGGATLTRANIHHNTVNSRQISSTTTLAGGGGVRVDGHLALSASQVIGNKGRAGLFLGRVCTDCPATFSGGGIRAGSVLGSAVTIADNEALGQTQLADGAPTIFLPGVSGGGGIAADEWVTLTNATLVGNRTSEPFAVPPVSWVAPPKGAAVYASSIQLVHATITDNLNAPSLETTSLTSYRSVVLAAAPRPICQPGLVVAASGSNWFNDTSCALSGSGDRQESADFLLAPLTDNGGPVPTRLPAAASVLKDQIPTNLCSTPVDARGMTRPQGPACDIGAVEIALAPGTGPTDLALSFTNPPALAVAGQAATWQLTVVNRGNAGSLPAVQIDVPTGVTITRAIASGSAICSTADPVLCIWSGGVPPGGSATITLNAQVGSQVTGDLLWSARVLAPDLLPPLTDDRAELATPTRVDSGMSMSLRFRRDTDQTGQRVTIASVWLHNSGPSNALGTSTQPIQVLFNPAPGVTATALGETRLLGSFPPGDALMAIEFAIGVAGALPARLGSLELRPGANPQAPVPAIEVFAADLELRGFRASGVQAPGTPLAFRYEVTNHGPATAPATQLEVSIDTASYTWTPSRGTVEPASSGPQAVVWRIGALAPGETATLNGSVTGAESWSSPSVYLSSEAIDFNGLNEHATLNLGPAPAGTADL
ncbi:MAG TPA: choice-of-anchor Q domain-containing protein, partial [Polyangiaceae bacterium]